MNNTQDFIAQIRAANPEWSNDQIHRYANTGRWIANPVPAVQVPKPLNINAIATLLEPKERAKIIQDLNGLYLSLLTNIKGGSMVDVVVDIQNIMAAEYRDGVRVVSQDTVNVLTLLLGNQETIADPDWESEIFQAPHKDAGIDPLLSSDLEAI